MEGGETSASSQDAARPWQSYHTAYTNAKAGMEGVDKEKVQRVIYEMSKGSEYFKNEERKEASIKQKIEAMCARRAKLTSADLCHYQMVADKIILELEATRDLSRIWLHVDMDAFYAAVETLSDPSLKGKPMAVGSMSMISTANYEARKFGVRAAMPGFIARKLCPQLILVPVDFNKYTKFSALTRKVFERYDPNFMASSLDEAYLDITEICKESGSSSEEIAEEIRSSVFRETGLTCSAGVAPNRLLAKVCSDIKKPNGQYVLPNDRTAVMTFISSLPVRKVGGIGKVTERLLQNVFEINTCEDMLQSSGLLCAFFSHSSSVFFLSVGLGIGQTDAPLVQLRKSISNEQTFSATDNEALFYQKLEELADMLSVDVQKEGLHGRTLTLKLKTASFEVKTRAMTSQRYICSKEDIMNHASKLLKAELPVSLRLIGLRMSHFSEEEKGGAPSDPSQKTISSFLVSGDVRENHSNLSVAGIGPKSCETCQSDSADLPNNQLSVHCACSYGCDADEAGTPHVLPKNLSAEKVDTYDVDLHSCKLPQLVKSDYFFSEQFKCKNISSIVGEKANPGDAIPSACNYEEFSWVDDYKCPLCGIELPSNFVEERQEHLDFHLAERLQRDESITYPRNSLVRPREQMEGSSVHTKQKKRKKLKSGPSKGKYPTIDLFFG